MIYVNLCRGKVAIPLSNSTSTAAATPPSLSPAHSPLHLRSLCLLRSLSFSPSPVSLSFMLTFTLCIVGLSLSLSHGLTISLSSLIVSLCQFHYRQPITHAPSTAANRFNFFDQLVGQIVVVIQSPSQFAAMIVIQLPHRQQLSLQLVQPQPSRRPRETVSC